MDLSLVRLARFKNIARLARPHVFWNALTEIFSASEYAFVSRLIGVSRTEFTSLMQELTGDDAFQRQLAQEYEVRIGGAFHMQRFNRLLYVLVRAMKPALVVETGVAAGISSAVILKAMAVNGGGELYSIDLPFYEPSQVNFETTQKEKPGWIIPAHLGGRWHFVEGASHDVLKPLMERLGNVDIFFHDSLHTYENMMEEYETAWPSLRKGGLLLSDNIDWNDAFHDFARRVGLNHTEKYHFGGIIKSSE